MITRALFLVRADQEEAWGRWHHEVRDILIPMCSVISLPISMRGPFSGIIALHEWWGRRGFNLAVVRGIPHIEILKQMKVCHHFACRSEDGGVLRFTEQTLLSSTLGTVLVENEEISATWFERTLQGLAFEIHSVGSERHE